MHSLLLLTIADSVSPQTRSGALMLLSTMAAILPEAVLSHLMPVFQFIGNTTLSREDSYTFYIVQKVRVCRLPLPSCSRGLFPISSSSSLPLQCCR